MYGLTDLSRNLFLMARSNAIRDERESTILRPRGPSHSGKGKMIHGKSNLAGETSARDGLYRNERRELDVMSSLRLDSPAFDPPL